MSFSNPIFSHENVSPPELVFVRPSTPLMILSVTSMDATACASEKRNDAWVIRAMADAKVLRPGGFEASAAIRSKSLTVSVGKLGALTGAGAGFVAACMIMPSSRGQLHSSARLHLLSAHLML